MEKQKRNSAWWTQRAQWERKTSEKTLKPCNYTFVRIFFSRYSLLRAPTTIIIIIIPSVIIFVFFLFSEKRRADVYSKSTLYTLVQRFFYCIRNLPRVFRFERFGMDFFSRRLFVRQKKKQTNRFLVDGKKKRASSQYKYTSRRLMIPNNVWRRVRGDSNKPFECVVFSSC